MALLYLNNINFVYLLIGLVIGLIYGYITKDVKRIIRYNKMEGRLVYEDIDENKEKCYKYVAEEIKCPNSEEILVHPTTYG
jgi:uncharacterized membrane-anchored protein YhcB (DUF1043 family)